MDCSTLKLLTQKKRSTSLPDLLSHQPTQKSLYSTKVSNNSGSKSSMYRKTHVPKNGESRNDKRKPERKIRKDDDHGDFCAFSNYEDQLNKTTNDGFEDNPHDMHRQRKKESRRNKVVKGSANILGSRFTGGFKVNPLCDIFVHHVAHQSTLGDLKNHLRQQGFDVAGMRIDVTSNEAEMYKSFRIISSGNLRKALLDPEIWPVGVWVRDYEKLSINRPRNRPNSIGGQINYHNGS